MLTYQLAGQGVRTEEHKRKQLSHPYLKHNHIGHIPISVFCTFLHLNLNVAPAPESFWFGHC